MDEYTPCKKPDPTAREAIKNVTEEKTSERPSTKKKAGEPEMHHLDAKAKAALEMGLSYGKYVAWQRGLLRVKGFDDNGKTT